MNANINSVKSPLRQQGQPSSAAPGRALSVLILLTLLLSACNYPGLSSDSDQDTSDIAATETSIAQTLEALSATTEVPEATAQPPSPTVVELPPTPTTTFALPPTLTPTNPIVLTTAAPPTPTQGLPIIRADIDTNCRQGPNKLYLILGYLLVGQQSTVHGRNDNSGNPWWYIQNPKKPGQFCWVWGQSTRVEGDTSQLPIITPPPPPTLTPTAAAAIAIDATFSNVHHCGGVPTAIFMITNTGGLAIESVNLAIKDLTTNTTVYSQGSNEPFFSSPSGCPPGASALAPGATAYVGGALGMIPAGNQLRATAKLCSGDYLTGECLVFKFDFGMP